MSTASTPLALNSHVTLATSLIGYPLLFFFITPRNPTPSRFAKSREAISALHCSFVTLASIYELQRRYGDWDPYSASLSLSGIERSAIRTEARPVKGCGCGLASAQTDSRANGIFPPLITARSALGNSITAFEMGYLVQDAVIMILGARLRARDPGGKQRSLSKEINWRVLGWHHAGLSSALGVLQWYIARGREKGIMVVLMMMLMNASTPIGTLHWYLVNFRPSRRQAIFVVHITYLLSYGICRVYLLYWILHVFGSQTGCSAMETFSGLRIPCQLGTATIGTANSIWIILGIRNFVRRYLSRAMPRKGK